MPASSRSSLAVNFHWMLAGRLVYAGCQWAVLIVIAKLGSATTLGQFTLGLALVAPIVLFSQLNLRAYQATDARDEYSFVDYFTLRLLASVAVFVCVIGILFVGDYDKNLVLVISGITLFKILESISDVYYGRLQKQEVFHRIALSQILRGLTLLLSMTVALVISGQLPAGVYLISLAWAALLVFFDARDPRQRIVSTARIDFTRLRSLTVRCLPLGIVVMLVSLASTVPVYLIGYFENMKQVGYYSAIAYFIAVGQLVVGSLIQTAAPRLSRDYAHRKLASFRRVIVKLVFFCAAIGIAGVLVAVLAGPRLLTFLYGADFAKNSDVFIWIMAAGGIGYIASVFGGTLTVFREFRRMMLLNCFSVCLVLVLSWVLIPRFGLLGAAWATAFTNAAKLLLNFIWNYSHLQQLSSATPSKCMQ